MKLVYIFLMITFIFLSGCSGRAPQTSPEPQSTSTPETETTPAQTAENAASEEPATASQVILAYWEAMNSYDLERALSYYEEQYRGREEEEVKDDITRLKQFHVTLSVADVSEPAFIDEDKVRCEIILNTPIGDKNLVYLLERINGEWKIYLENDPEEFVEAEEFIIEFLAKYGESQRMDIIINAEQQRDIERGATELVLSELFKLGEIVELRPGTFSLPSQQ
jgi:hypothetical protein